MAHYAVGDIQGCLDELKALLQRIDFGPHDQLWLTGDLVNRGPHSLETLRFVKGLGDQARVVLGNHDLHLLAVARCDARPSHKDTLDAILEAPDREPLLDWLQRQPLLHRDAALGYTMVHAGLPPQWSLTQAQDYAGEVEAALRGEDADTFFRQMYGNQPDLWDDGLRGWERLRCITNYLTRMRFCDARGRLELKTKTNPQHPPQDCLPWYAHPQRATAGERILFGHWAALQGKAHTPNVFALDTGCIWGGDLTAMRLEDQQLFSVDSPGYA